MFIVIVTYTSEKRRRAMISGTTISLITLALIIINIKTMKYQLPNNISSGYDHPSVTISDESLDPDLDTGVKAFCPLCNRRLRYDSAGSVYRCLDCVYVYQYDKTTGIKNNNNKNSGIRPLTDSGMTGEKLLIDSVGREPRGLLGATQDPAEAMEALKPDPSPKDKWLASLGAVNYKEVEISKQSSNVISPQEQQAMKLQRQRAKMQQFKDRLYLQEREKTKQQL